MARVRFLRIVDRFCTQTSRFQLLNPTCCIRLATSFNTVQHRPTMLDSTMLDDVGSVWPGLYMFAHKQFRRAKHKLRQFQQVQVIKYYSHFFFKKCVIEDTFLLHQSTSNEKNADIYTIACLQYFTSSRNHKFPYFCNF